MSALVAADFDNDGHSEMLVVTTRHTDSVRDSTSFILSCRPSDILWRSPTTGSVFSSPVIADVSGDGRPDVVVASRDTRVYALSGDDGHPLWSQPTEGVIEAFLAVGDLDGDGVDEVVTGSDSGGVYAYRGGDGNLLWPPFRTGGLVFARSALADFDGDGKNDVACASKDGFLYRLKGTDGRLIGAPLHVEGNLGFRSSPRLVDLDGDPVKDLVIGTLDGRLCGFSGTGGPPLWTVPIAVDGATDLQREVRSSANLADFDGDQVQDFVIGGADGVLYAVKGGQAPSVLWRFPTDNIKINSSPAVADLDGDGVKDVVVGGQEDEMSGRGCWVYAISGAKGTLHWKYRTGGGTWSSPLLRDVDADGIDDVLIGSSDRHLYVLSGRDGALLVRFALDGRVYSSPSMADVNGDGVPEVVVGSHDNHVYALSLSRERIEARKRVPPLRRAREDLAAGAAEAVMTVPAEPTRGLRELHFASAKAFLQRGRHASAAVELRLAALGGLRSGELGALHLLCALSTAGRLDDGLVHACVLTDPIGFLLVLTTPAELRDAVDDGSVRAALEPVLAQGFVPAHRNAALADGVLRLLLDRPRTAHPKPETDPVRADYLRTLRTLSAILAGAQDVDLAGSRTVAGERFASCWVEDAPKIRERLRLPTAD